MQKILPQPSPCSVLGNRLWVAEQACLGPNPWERGFAAAFEKVQGVCSGLEKLSSTGMKLQPSYSITLQSLMIIRLFWC